MEKLEHFGLSFSEFSRVMDHLHDEIVVYDRQFRIVYVNKACMRHYGYTQQEMIGKTFQHFAEENSCWNNSVLPMVYKLKKPLSTKQKTYIGTEIFTIAVPLLDDTGEVEYVLMSVRDLADDDAIQRLADVADAVENPREHLLEGLVYRSRSMSRVIELAGQVSELTAPCLLLGETGCGKSLLAKYIHTHSPRREKPFVVVNCAGIPQDLFESELFGHKRGAFTGAVSDKIGLFAQAEGGTLFLDEISELPLAMQAKLLHAVQEREFRPVGDSVHQQADVKLLAATNRDLRSMVQTGAFREDLYYRLNVFEITLPPLRHRRDDLTPLIYFFLNQLNRRYGCGRKISDEALAVMQRYTWPGNVRELSHVVERLVVTAGNDLIEVRDLPASLYETRRYELSSPNEVQDLALAMEAHERSLVLDAVSRHGSTRNVAAALSISQTKAARLMRKYRAP